MVLDEAYFPESLNALQVGGVMAKTYRRWDGKQYQNYLTRFGLPEKKPFKDFSRGMKMKLALAVAFSHHAKLLVLDEATSGLDPVVRDDILDLFLEFVQEEDHAILVSSHITSDLEKVAITSSSSTRAGWCSVSPRTSCGTGTGCSGAARPSLQTWTGGHGGLPPAGLRVGGPGGRPGCRPTEIPQGGGGPGHHGRDHAALRERGETMKGLLLKDYYLIGSVLWILLAAMAVIGIAMAVLTSAWALVVIATVMLGMVSVSTINMDKASGWYKVSRVMPVARQAVVDSKYLLYLLLSGVGLLLGMVLGMVASLIQGGQSGEEALLYLTISVAMALLAGSVTLPCSFLFSEEKNVLAIFLAYPAAAGIFAGVVVPPGGHPPLRQPGGGDQRGAVCRLLGSGSAEDRLPRRGLRIGFAQNKPTAPPPSIRGRRCSLRA